MTQDYYQEEERETADEYFRSVAELEAEDKAMERYYEEKYHQ